MADGILRQRGLPVDNNTTNGHAIWCRSLWPLGDTLTFRFFPFSSSKHQCCCPCIARFKTLRPRQNGRHLADDTFKRIFMNENVRISIKISLKFVPKGLINNIPALVQMMAWRRPGDNPLSEPMMVSLLTHICVTRPQWVKMWNISISNHKNHNQKWITYLSFCSASYVWHHFQYQLQWKITIPCMLLLSVWMNYEIMRFRTKKYI